jgi:transcriptional regulator with XRE-family HTH domain
MNKFGERLKELRMEEGLSQDQLAKKVGLTHTAIGLWELNKRVPNLDAVIVLANYFKVSLDYIAGLED